VGGHPNSLRALLTGLLEAALTTLMLPLTGILTAALIETQRTVAQTALRALERMLEHALAVQAAVMGNCEEDWPLSTAQLLLAESQKLKGQPLVVARHSHQQLLTVGLTNPVLC